MTPRSDLAELRRELIEEFCRLPGAADVMEWQRHLAAAIIDAERAAPGQDVSELKLHRHLLRVIGDALVHTLLPSHTIRALSRRPERPASLAAQGADFDFVLEIADGLRKYGFTPIIADLTTLIDVGDIVAWRSEGVVVLECKNRPVPSRIPTSGRVARQRERGEQLETYLRTSQVVEPSGLTRVATPAELPQPDWLSVQRVLVDCQDSDQGFAVITLGAGDYLVACDRRLEEPERLGDVWPGARAAALPALAYSELLRDSGYLTPAPSNYPLPAGLRWALLERELVLFRLVDMAQLDANFKHANVAVSLRTAKADGMFEVQVDSPAVDDFAFSPSLINYCLWAPVPVASMREFLVGYTRRVVGKLMETDDLTCAVPPAVGDQVVYATAYQNNSGRLREPTSAASNNPAPDTVGT